jgi:hypothetical protein
MRGRSPAGHRTFIAAAMTAVVAALFLLTLFPTYEYIPSIADLRDRGFVIRSAQDLANVAIRFDRVDDFSQRVRLALKRTESSTGWEADRIPVVDSKSTTAQPKTDVVGAEVTKVSTTTRTLALLVSGIIFAIFGLIVLWWGRDAASLWLGLFCASFAAPLFHPFGALPEWAMLLGWSIVEILSVLAIYSLYALAEAVALHAIRHRWTYQVIVTVRVAVLFLVSISLAVDLAGKWLPTIWGDVLPNTLEPFTRSWLTATFVVAMIAAPLALLAAAAAYGADARLRRNAVVIFITTALGVSGLAVSIAQHEMAGMAPAFDVWWFTLLLIPIGFIVTILTLKVVDVKVVITRVLVLASMTAIVGIIIAITETIAKNYVDKKWPELATPSQFLIAFIIVFSFAWMHRAVAERVHRFVFRRQVEAVRDLRKFAHNSAFINSRDLLLGDAVAEICRSLGARGAALYEEGVAGYDLLQSCGASFASKVDADDRAFVHLRASLARVDLAQITPQPSRLGDDGFAFPMAVCGKVVGALAIGPRTDESEGPYVEEELDALDDVAQSIGDALFRMRATEISAFVGTLADGNLDNGAISARARELRARGLIG